MKSPDKIRNLAIIAHIDHGKTTLIDSIFRETHVFRQGARVAERVMDSMDLERERGITIRAKNCSVEWGDYRFNILDTPGHADFSGEVERVLSMVDGVLLLVDANEGPMPQTRYVLMRALRRGLAPIVVLNKIDRPGADPTLALHDTFDLFVELGATDEQADFPVLYGSGLQGWIAREPAPDAQVGLDPLFETIIDHVPVPNVVTGAPFRLQVVALDWSDYVGQIGFGRVLQGSHRRGEPIVRTVTRWIDRDAGVWTTTETETGASTHLWVTTGIEREEVSEVGAGDIVWLAGLDAISLGDTLSAPDLADPALAPLEIEEPTVSMLFLVNSGPFGGSEGKAVTLRQIRDRLQREERVNVGLRVEDEGRADGLKVSGRGELHLAILIEEMRREGIELCVSRPEVIVRAAADGTPHEPIEHLVMHVPEEHQGVVFEKVARRLGELLAIHNTGSGLIRLEFTIPTRGLIGYRTEFLTDTRGLGIMTSRLTGYGPWRGAIESRNRGAMVSLDTGPVTSHALETLQQRGTLFVEPGDRVYTGMIVGESARPGDIPCNPTRRKHVTNHRSAVRDVDTVLKTPRRTTLEVALEWIAEDELVEVTPASIRVRKAVLDATERKRIARRAVAASI